MPVIPDNLQDIEDGSTRVAVSPAQRSAIDANTAAIATKADAAATTTALAGKAALSHTHVVGDVTGLGTAATATLGTSAGQVPVQGGALSASTIAATGIVTASSTSTHVFGNGSTGSIKVGDLTLSKSPGFPLSIDTRIQSTLGFVGPEWYAGDNGNGTINLDRGRTLTIGNAYPTNNSSGATTHVSMSPTISQSGSAGYTVLDINPTVSSVGTGGEKLQRWAVANSEKAAIDAAGNVKSVGKFIISGTDSAVLMTEINGQIVSFGTNYQQSGLRNTARRGAFFRVDARDAYTTELFSVTHQAPGSAGGGGNETQVFKVSTTGDVVATGGLTATGATFGGTGNVTAAGTVTATGGFTSPNDSTLGGIQLRSSTKTIGLSGVYGLAFFANGHATYQPNGTVPTDTGFDFGVAGSLGATGTISANNSGFYGGLLRPSNANDSLTLNNNNRTAAGTAVIAANGTYSHASGVVNALLVQPTSTGAGTTYGVVGQVLGSTGTLIPLAARSTTGTDVFTVSQYGQGVFANSITAGGFISGASLFGASVSPNSANSLLTLNANSFSVAGTAVVAATGAVSASSGTGYSFAARPPLATTGTAGHVVFHANPSGTHGGSGILYNWVGTNTAGTTTSSIDAAGNTILSGTLTLGNTTTPGKIVTQGKTATSPQDNVWEMRRYDGFLEASFRPSGGPSYSDGRLYFNSASIETGGSCSFGNTTVSGLFMGNWSMSGTTIETISTGQILWANGSSRIGTKDIGLARESANVLKVTNGSSGYGNLELAALTATGTVKPGSINTTTTPGTVAGQLCFSTITGKLSEWDGSTWQPLR